MGFTGFEVTQSLYLQYVLFPAHFRQGYKVQYTVGHPQGRKYLQPGRVAATDIDLTSWMLTTDILPSTPSRHANLKKPPKPTTWTCLRRWHDGLAVIGSMHLCVHATYARARAFPRFPFHIIHQGIPVGCPRGRCGAAEAK